MDFSVDERIRRGHTPVDSDMGPSDCSWEEVYRLYGCAVAYEDE